MSGENAEYAVLIRGRRLAKNTLWNLLSQGVPLLVALLTIPQLIHGLGIDRFGVLSLAWMVIGYFSLFDMGLGRALTKLVAEKLGTGQTQDIPALVWTALVLMSVLGLMGAIVIGALAPWLVHSALNIPAPLQMETLQAFYLLAFSIPIVISTAGLAGLLQAYQRFDLINALNIPLGVFIYLGPLVALHFSNHLLSVVAVLAAGRLLGWGGYLLMCLRLVPMLRHGIRMRRALLRPLLSFGGWMTISNIIGSLMMYFNSFLIGALTSIASVAYYATPYNIVTKCWLISIAFGSVLFPAFSATSTSGPVHTARLVTSGTNTIFLGLFPLVLIIVTLAHEGLTFWLGVEFAQNSTHVLQWLAIGTLINSLAYLPYLLIQASGRGDLTAKLHLIELPFYLLALWWLIETYGIQGAAIAWVALATVNMLLLFGMAQRMLPALIPFIRCLALALGIALFILIIGASISGDLITKGAFLLLALVLFAPGFLGAAFHPAGSSFSV
jgi:O-antigen/teichoic acid export membrane protein